MPSLLSHRLRLAEEDSEWDLPLGIVRPDASDAPSSSSLRTRQRPPADVVQPPPTRTRQSLSRSSSLSSLSSLSSVSSLSPIASSDQGTSLTRSTDQTTHSAGPTAVGDLAEDKEDFAGDTEDVLMLETEDTSENDDWVRELGLGRTREQEESWRRYLDQIGYDESEEEELDGTPVSAEERTGDKGDISGQRRRAGWKRSESPSDPEAVSAHSSAPETKRSKIVVPGATRPDYRTLPQHLPANLQDDPTLLKRYKRMCAKMQEHIGGGGDRLGRRGLRIARERDLAWREYDIATELCRDSEAVAELKLCERLVDTHITDYSFNILRVPATSTSTAAARSVRDAATAQPGRLIIALKPQVRTARPTDDDDDEDSQSEEALSQPDWGDYY